MINTHLNIGAKMEESFPPYIYNIIKLIGNLADETGAKAYIVGGVIRDLYLGEKNFDIDITVKPNGIEFAKVLAARLKGKLVIHRRFGTASVFLKWPQAKQNTTHPGIIRIDIATARTERYERPGALPLVSFSSIKDDLYRRDFTINAIAVSLNPESFGEVIDFFGGQKDIKKGIIRALHDKSFIDDPTRIFRAVRFEQRFNFGIEPHTMELIKNAVNLKMFEKVEKQRIRDEIILILKEKNPLKTLLRMNELHEFRFIHPEIKLTKKVLNLLYSIKDSTAYFNKISRKKRAIDIWLIYFMGLLEELSLKETESLCAGFCFRKGDHLRILSYKEKGNSIFNFLNKLKTVRPSRIYKALEPFSFEVMLLIYAKSKNKQTKMKIHNFLTKHNGTRLNVRGDDLKRLGIKVGPKFKDILEKTLYAKIDGQLKDKKDEEDFVLKKFKTRIDTDKKRMYTDYPC